MGGELLGYPVRPASSKVLYVAADRPAQGGRSLRRMLLGLSVDDDFARVESRLLVSKGPLPFDLVRDPGHLAPWVASHEASDVFLDSLGLIVPALTKDEVGAAVAQAFSLCSASGIEVVAPFHPRKATSDNRKPNKLEDVYGSRWLTSVSGSVLLLWGQAGDPIVELRHLKQPSEPVGPFMVEIDHRSGGVSVAEGSDLLAVLRAVTNGLSAKEAGLHMEGGNEKAREKKAYRKLEGYVAKGLAHRREGAQIRGSIHEADRYYATGDAHGDGAQMRATGTDGDARGRPSAFVLVRTGTLTGTDGDAPPRGRTPHLVWEASSSWTPSPTASSRTAASRGC